MNESITVSALNNYAKALIEQDEVLSQVWIEGEISGFQVHQKSGHAYFSLRDSDCAVRAVMFCAYASELRFLPKDGMYVIAKCRVTLYERDGSFQINVFDLIPRGVGTVQKQAEDVKKKLEQEGLFLPQRKRALPLRPKTVAVITSASSAALQDIISVVGKLNPTVTLKVFSANVQGFLAVPSLISAIHAVNADKSVDVAILARGGGSKEDLWYFNDEALVRAAASLQVPFISAVGHETDYTLVDYVSDARAETPSAAAAMAVHDIWGDWAYIQALYCDMSQHIELELKKHTAHIHEQRKTSYDQINRLIAEKLERLIHTETLCRSLDPMNVLMRGYSRTLKDSVGVSSVHQLTKGDHINVAFHDGSAACIVDQIVKG